MLVLNREKKVRAREKDFPFYSSMLKKKSNFTSLLMQNKILNMFYAPIYNLE